MGRERDGRRTRDRLADALLGLMEASGLDRIRVQDVAGAAGVNRQTFYYHFADIYALAEYAYDREITRLFGVDDIEATFTDVSPREHSVRILQALRDSPEGLRNLLFFFNRRSPKGHFYDLIRHRAELSLSPRLREAGVGEGGVAMFEDMWATAVVAVLLDWLRGGQSLTADEVVRLMDAASEDLADGAARRGALA